MNEFNNRIDAQREILSRINSIKWQEELYGLSQGAIDRWARANAVAADSGLLRLIIQAAEKLFFLANKSQEQITGEYRQLSSEVAELARRIEALLSQATSHR